MEDKINSIDINGKIDHEEIYNLFKTHSSEVNEKISEKIDIFKDNIEFFKYYSNKDVKNLLNIFQLKTFENNDESFSSFPSYIDRYISCISQIVLLIKLFFKTQDILKKMLINSKNYLSKLKNENENELENYNHDYLFLYLDSLLKNSEKPHKVYSSTSTVLSSNISSFEIIPKNQNIPKFDSEIKNISFSDDEIESIIYDMPSTPRFELDRGFENKSKKNSEYENSVKSNSIINNDSIFTLSEIIIPEKIATPKNLGSKLIKRPIINTKVKCKFYKERKLQSEKAHKVKKVNTQRHIFSETELNNKKRKKNLCINLLEMISKIYREGLINAEEKVKLKQLVIVKSKKIENLYYNIYKNIKIDKNMLVVEVKKIVN